MEQVDGESRMTKAKVDFIEKAREEQDAELPVHSRSR